MLLDINTLDVYELNPSYIQNFNNEKKILLNFQMQHNFHFLYFRFRSLAIYIKKNVEIIRKIHLTNQYTCKYYKSIFSICLFKDLTKQ